MVDTSLVAGGAVIFFVLLAVIIYGSRGEQNTVKVNKRERNKKSTRNEQPIKQEKPKKKTAAKKSERVQEGPKKYAKVDASQEKRELEEFLKGRDKAEILRVLTQEERNEGKKKGNKEQSSVESRPEIAKGVQINEKEAATFEPVKQKPKREKKAKAEDEAPQQEVDAEGNPIQKKGPRGKKKRNPDSYFKSEEEAAEKEAAEKKAAWEAREAEKADRKRREAAGEVVERKPRVPRERKEGEEERPRRVRYNEDGTEEERKPRGPKIPTFEEVEKAVSYEQADIGDLLSMFGQPSKGSQPSGGAQPPKDQ